MTTEKLTRRRMIALTGGTATAAIAGCVTESVLGGSGTDQVTAYVVAYHWGFAVFSEDGEEIDTIEMQPGTELTVHAVNDHASDAFDELPEPVAEQLEDFDALARTRQKVEAGELSEPDGTTVEEAYEEAHGHDDNGHDDDDHGHDDHGHDDDDHGHDDNGHDDDDHGHDDNGHDDNGHDDDHGHDDDGHDHAGGMLEHGFAIDNTNISLQLPGDQSVPASASAVLDEPGTYTARCSVHCGYYHGEQQEDLFIVTEE